MRGRHEERGREKEELEIERKRQKTDRETDRQTDRQTDRRTELSTLDGGGHPHPFKDGQETPDGASSRGESDTAASPPI